MTVQYIDEVEFGSEIENSSVDTSLGNVSTFAEAVGWNAARFQDHDKAKKEGLPGALVPGIMGVGFLSGMIHAWAPTARIVSIDTVFRAPMLADAALTLSAIVTDIDEREARVELDLTVRNQKDETRLFGTAIVEFPRRGMA